MSIREIFHLTIYHDTKKDLLMQVSAIRVRLRSSYFNLSASYWWTNSKPANACWRKAS